MRSVVAQYSGFQGDGVSFADIVVLGALDAVRSCGGPIIPFYWGRTDVSSGGPTDALPEAEDSTESHVQRFARMGFSPSDMIAMVACGHTLGGVHSANNPALTSQGYHHFDNTFAHFDNHVAVDHFNAASPNPLGQQWNAANPGASSDTRIFAVDGNVTIGRMAQSDEAFHHECVDAFSKMWNDAVPSSVTLKGPMQPLKVATSFRSYMRNGVISFNLGNARLYDMEGQWSSFEVGYYNRDGSVGTDNSILQVGELTTFDVGVPLETKAFNFLRPSIDPATGLGGMFVNVQMKDGSAAPIEADSFQPFQDTVLIDYGNLYTCKYKADASKVGLNMTAVVLAPYDASDKVEFFLRTSSGDQLVRGAYRGPRDEYYNLYNVFIEDIDAIGLTDFTVQLTRSDGTVIRDTHGDGTLYSTSVGTCGNGEIFPSNPVPSGTIARRRQISSNHEAPVPCPRGWLMCSDRCTNTASDLEHCGGCAGFGGIDCTTVSDGTVACIQGKCVVTDESY